MGEERRYSPCSKHWYEILSMCQACMVQGLGIEQERSSQGLCSMQLMRDLEELNNKQVNTQINKLWPRGMSTVKKT